MTKKAEREAEVLENKRVAYRAKVKRLLGHLFGRIEIATLPDRSVSGDAVRVAIKPLEWKDHSDSIYDKSSYAKSPLGQYQAFSFKLIGKTTEKVICGWTRPYGQDIHVDSFEAAKAAAQADYEAKIRSALTLGGHSLLYVIKPNGAREIWKTQQIVNVSKLGRFFNQWPSRRVGKK